MEGMKKMIFNLGIGALIFAVWFVTLFFGKDIGLSMLLFLTPFSYFLIQILEKNNKIKDSKAKLLLIPIILLSSTYFIYDNSFFNNLNLIIIPVLVSIMVLGAIGEKFEINIDTIGKLLGSFFNPLSYIEESMVKFVDNIKEKLKINVDTNKEKKTKKVMKAIFITIPLVLVIIALLSSADEVFANIFKGIFNQIINVFSTINISTTFLKIIFIAIAFFYFIGLFYYICIDYEVIDNIDKKQEKKYDNFTIKMILISLNIIYLIFCYIQIKSLFIRSTTLNYAHYARQGFFQLMIVSLINLVTILLAKKRENREEGKSNKFINYMSLIMIFFTFIIVISAGVRMYFYESTYGYTLLRLLVYCTLFTECVLFIPTILYILDKNVNLPKLYFIIITIVYICMNFSNFDNIIARKNIDRYIETGKIDIYYLEDETGADAIKQMLRILEIELDEEGIKMQTIEYLNEVYNNIDREKMDFRNFNISKFLAKNLIAKELQLKNNERI